MPERGRDIERIKRGEKEGVGVFRNLLLFREQFASYVGQRGIGLANQCLRKPERGRDIEKKNKV